VSGKKA